MTIYAPTPQLAHILALQDAMTAVPFARDMVGDEVEGYGHTTVQEGRFLSSGQNLTKLGRLIGDLPFQIVLPT